MRLRPSCVVADDHPPVLASVCRYLGRNGYRIAGRAGNGQDAVALVQAERPDFAVLDLRMPELGGAAVARQLSRTVPETAVVAYSGYADGALLVEALDAGVQGFVLKDAPLETLLRALETVRGGGLYVDSGLADVVLRGASDRVVLTPRERDVLRLLADGHSNETIGKTLFISPDTARTQLSVAMAKLGAATRTQAVAIAIRNELIS